MFHVKQWSGSTLSPPCCAKKASSRISSRKPASISSGCATSPIRRSCSLSRLRRTRAGSIWARGAGFPGLVVAVLHQGPVTLVEERRLRAEFLHRAAETLGVQVEIIASQGRANRRPILRCDQRPRLRPARRVCSTWAQACPQQRRSGCFPRAETPRRNWRRSMLRGRVTSGSKRASPIPMRGSSWRKGSSAGRRSVQ